MGSTCARACTLYPPPHTHPPPRTGVVFGPWVRAGIKQLLHGGEVVGHNAGPQRSPTVVVDCIDPRAAPDKHRHALKVPREKNKKKKNETEEYLLGLKRNQKKT